jgi:hypothetical protein
LKICIASPTDPSGEDEPYLWAFLLQADGTNIHQRAGDPGHLSANITIHSGSGRPGNLGVDSFKSGGNIHIPPAIGNFSASLKPIRLVFSQGSLSVRVFLPATVAIFCLAIDEDGTKRDAMEGAFNDVKNEVQNRFNDFLNGLDLQSMATDALASPNPVAAFQASFDQQRNNFLAELPKHVTDVAIQSAEISVMSDFSLWDPFSWLASADADEPVGSHVFFFTEQSIIDGNLAAPMHSDLRQPSSGFGGAWYIVDGHAEADIHFAASDLLMNAPKVRSVPIILPQTTFVFQRMHPCVAPGTTVTVKASNNTQTFSISVQYPFVQYQYMIDGQMLVENSGSIILTKTVKSQVFDEDSSGFIKNIDNVRPVTLNFSKTKFPNDPQTEVLSITNNPDDGNYDVKVTVNAVLNNGRVIPVGDQFLFFEGMTVRIQDDFIDRYRECVRHYFGDGVAKSKVASYLDTHANGPEERSRQFERITEQLDVLAAVGAFQQVSVDKAKLIFAGKLKVTPKTNTDE